MNIIYNRRIEFKIILKKYLVTNSIKKIILNLGKENEFIKYKKDNNKKYDALSNMIYFYFIDNLLIINFSHLYYDAYSIFFILNKLDQIYKNEILNYKFQIYEINKSNYEYIKNYIKIIKNIPLNNILNIFLNKNKKSFKIKKKELSNSEIIKYILTKLKINKYCLVVNARKKFNDCESILRNYIYITKTLDINDNIREVISNDNDEYNDLINRIPECIMINSYLGFTLPSFSDDLEFNMTTIGNLVLIHPNNENSDYIKIDYYL